MATLENNTGYNLSGASVRVFFGEQAEALDVLISEKLFTEEPQQLKITLNSIRCSYYGSFIQSVK